MKHRKAPLVILPVIIIAAVVYLLLQKTIPKNNRFYTASGTVEVTQIELSAKLVAQVTKVYVTEGDPVKKDQLLVELNQDELQTKLTQSRAITAAAKEQVNQIKINLDNVTDNLTRTQELFNTGSVSQQQLDTIKTQYETLQSQFAAAKFNLQQTSAAEELVQTQIKNVYFRSPINGTIISRNVESGETVFPGMVVVSLSDLTEVWVKIYLPGPQLGIIKLGDKVEISTDSFPDKKYSGTITNIATKAEFTPKNIQIKEERTKLVYAVKISIPNPEQELKPGMPADAIIEIK